MNDRRDAPAADGGEAVPPWLRGIGLLGLGLMAFGTACLVPGFLWNLLARPLDLPLPLVAGFWLMMAGLLLMLPVIMFTPGPYGKAEPGKALGGFLLGMLFPFR